MLAVPLLALLTLDASAFEVALIAALQNAPMLLFGLPAGAWCDRLRSRPVLVATDLGRAVLLGSIPAAAAADLLTLRQLYVVVFLVGVLTVFFDVAHQSYLPRLVARADLVEGNAKLHANLSFAAVSGGAAGGYLVQSLTAPVTILIDVLSYLWSALWVRSIRKPETRPARPEQPHLRREIGEGLRFVLGDPILRVLAAYGATAFLFQAAGDAITIVFLVRDVGLSPGAIGLLGAVSLLGALAAAAVTGRIAGTVGSARALWILALVNGAGFLIRPLTQPGWQLGFYVVGGFTASFCIIATSILGISARQLRCPDQLLGRVGATTQVLLWGMVPVGAVLGGAIATLAGARAALWFSAAGVALAALWLVLSPLRSARDLPD